MPVPFWQEMTAGGKAPAGLTTTVTLLVVSGMPAFEQVISKIWVLAGIPVRFSDPPETVFAPDQKFEATQLVGLPVVIQVRVVAPSAVSGPDGLAERETEIAPVGMTVTEDRLEFPPAFVQYNV